MIHKPGAGTKESREMGRGKSSSTPPDDGIAACSGALPRPQNIRPMIHE